MSKLTFLPLVLITAALPAQRPGPGGGMPPPPPPPPAYTITTATDFGVFADLGGTIDYAAIPSGTAITAGTGVRAHSGAFWQGDAARAAAGVMPARLFGRGEGATVHEVGGVVNADATRGASAGTAADAPGTTAPVQAAHGIRLDYPNIPAGATAIVSIQWLGYATAGASTSASVDVDGDSVADFTGVGDGNRASAALQVTAGATGVSIAVTTSGSAAVAAAGREHYQAVLSVYVREGALPTSCTFTSFGPTCGATLTGNVGTNLDLSLDVTGAPAGAFGFLAIGDQLAAPLTLPLGGCDLLVDSMRRHHIGVSFRTDALGDATIGLRTPRSALTISFQALILSYDPATQTRSLATSNGTELVCQ